MKVLILAGGVGSRLSEETLVKPKPMIEIGGKPILWHIMKLYSFYGHDDFIILCGYKSYLIKEYFANYYFHEADLTVDLKNNAINVHHSNAEPWQITMVDTGLDTMTGGRIKRVSDYIGKETFLLTYGDGVGNVNIGELIAFHKQHNKKATVTIVQPSGRFGTINFDDKEEVTVFSFQEKPAGDGSWINGGFFVCEPDVLNYIRDDQTIWEKEPLEHLAKEKELVAFKHYGFWKPMDTLREKTELENLWNTEKAPWKIWD